MLNSFLVAAAMLLVGPSMSNTQMVVEPQAIVAPSFTNFSKLNADTESTLIEKYAAPHWNLSIAEAWNYYRAGLMTITEISPEHHYLITFNDGILEVLLDDSNI